MGCILCKRSNKAHIAEIKEYLLSKLNKDIVDLFDREYAMEDRIIDDRYIEYRYYGVSIKKVMLSVETQTLLSVFGSYKSMKS